MVYSNQQAYYDAINRCSIKGNSGDFIDFMLQEILTTLKKRQGAPLIDVGTNVGANVGISVSINEQEALKLIKKNKQITAKLIAQKMGLSERQGERIVAALKKKGFIRRVGSAKTGHWEIV